MRPWPAPLLLFAACGRAPAPPVGPSADAGGDTARAELPAACPAARFTLGLHLPRTALPDRVDFDRAEHGAGFGDIDSDGDLDALIAWEGGSFVLRNSGAPWEPGGLQVDTGWTVDGAPLPGATTAILLDLDGDGDLDAFLGRSTADDDLLLLRVGAAEDFSPRPIAGSTAGTWSAAFGDLDGDLDLDLFIANRPPVIDEAGFLDGSLRGEPNHLVLQDAAGWLRADVRLPVGDNHGLTFQAPLLDADGDGDLDAYIANDGGHQVVPNQLWRNDGAARFSVDSLCACDRPMYAMGAAVGDWNDDLLPDLYVTNIGPQLYLESEGPARWVDQTLARGALIPPEPAHLASWGVAEGDLDRDGRTDLWVTFGRLQDGTAGVFGALPGTDPAWQEDVLQADVVLLAQPGGGFAQAALGLEASPGRARSVIFGDVDGDGDDDALVMGKHELKLWRAEGGCGPGLQVRIAGPPRNAHGLGARVSVRTAAGRQTRWMLPFRMHGNDDLQLTFGLGPEGRAEAVEVLLPDGQTWSAADLGPGALVVPWSPR
jgi:hypothetical protein